MSLLLADIKTYFRQFPTALAISYSINRTIARVFDKDAATTYSQFGEDRVLPFFLNPERNGFYVDVGANHPVKCSNTFWLYKLGWRGITVEPNEMLSKLHQKIRPLDTQVAALVSDSGAEVEFVQFENHLFSSASADHVNQWKDANNIVRRQKIKPRHLTGILDECRSPQNFDLLCVDVEGFDLPVLRSLDWSKYHPKMLVIEMSDYLPGQPHATVQFLAAKNFSLKAFDGFNGFFINVSA